MTISIECVQCEADFEYEVAELLKNPALLVCPNCGAKADPEVVEMAMSAVDELITHLRRLRRKFRFSIIMESDELTSSDSDEEMYAEEEDNRENLWSEEPEEEDEEE
jgi:DNA-directed RNA polymerase subunit RPC12/RpoP